MHIHYLAMTMMGYGRGLTESRAIANYFEAVGERDNKTNRGKLIIFQGVSSKEWNKDTNYFQISQFGEARIEGDFILRYREYNSTEWNEWFGAKELMDKLNLN